MEEISYLRIILALAFVLALIGLLGWILRRWESGRLAKGLAGARRMQVVEQLYLDAKRRLVLVRHDDAEYLLLLGPQGETVVSARGETGEQGNGERGSDE